jgi:rod shape-determining protein MreC
LKGATQFRKIWIWIFVVGFALFLLSSNVGRGRGWNPFEKLVIEALAPLQKAVMHAVRATEDFWLNYFFLVGLRDENRTLINKVNALRMENSRYRELLATTERLQVLLKFRQTIIQPAVAAQVIGRDPTGWFKSIIIDKGEKVGITLDMPVVSGRGVVGRVVSVSPNYAKALLIIDQNSAVDCLVQRSRERGMLKGFSMEACRLDYTLKTADIVVGDTVVTSGLAGVFPKGLPVGYISEVEDVSGKLFKDIKVRPAVDFSKLEEVLVILKEEESPAR